MNYISLMFLLFWNFFASTALVLDDGKLPRQTFKAAVYEHFVVLPPNRQTKVSRDVALANMMENLKVYQTQADAAGRMVRTIYFKTTNLFANNSVLGPRVTIRKSHDDQFFFTRRSG